MIKQALIMAAGHAKRMRPLTDNLPKPLLKVGGEPLLTHIIDHLIEAGTTRIVINGWHAIAPLKTYVETISKTHPDVDFILSEETELLETGGGAVQALQYLDPNEPFYMINGDAFWVNAPQVKTLKALADVQAETDADLVLLLQPTSSMAMTTPVGDYHLDCGGKATRAKDKNGDHMFAGVRIAHPRILDGYKPEFFSFLSIMDEQEEKGVLYGYAHQGDWYHISTPNDLDEVNKDLFGMSA